MPGKINVVKWTSMKDGVLKNKRLAQLTHYGWNGNKKNAT